MGSRWFIRTAKSSWAKSIKRLKLRLGHLYSLGQKTKGTQASRICINNQLTSTLRKCSWIYWVNQKSKTSNGFVFALLSSCIQKNEVHHVRKTAWKYKELFLRDKLLAVPDWLHGLIGIIFTLHSIEAIEKLSNFSLSHSILAQNYEFFLKKWMSRRDDVNASTQTLLQTICITKQFEVDPSTEMSSVLEFQLNIELPRRKSSGVQRVRHSTWGPINSRKVLEFSVFSFWINWIICFIQFLQKMTSDWDIGTANRRPALEQRNSRIFKVEIEITRG